jgi:hypothetical protein
LSLALSGCAHSPSGPAGARLAPPSPWSGAPVHQGGLDVATQYWPSTTARTGYNTFEVYLTNLGTGKVAFVSAQLDGKDLPLPRPLSMPRALASISLDGERVNLKQPQWALPPEVSWCQFYPCAEAAPGATTVFQVNFRERPASMHALVLADDAGRTVKVAVPRFRPPEHLLTAITFSSDYRRMYVQYRTDAAASAVCVNGWEIRRFRRLLSPQARTPHMLAFAAPFAIRTGTPLYVKVAFDDGSWQHAMVRALAGICLDAEGQLSPQERQAAGLDADPAIELLRVDVACNDATLGSKGASTPGSSPPNG